MTISRHSEGWPPRPMLSPSATDNSSRPGQAGYPLQGTSRRAPLSSAARWTGVGKCRTWPALRHSLHLQQRQHHLDAGRCGLTDDIHQLGGRSRRRIRLVRGGRSGRRSRFARSGSVGTREQRANIQSQCPYTPPGEGASSGENTPISSPSPVVTSTLCTWRSANVRAASAATT